MEQLFFAIGQTVRLRTADEVEAGANRRNLALMTQMLETAGPYLVLGVNKQEGMRDRLELSFEGNPVADGAGEVRSMSSYWFIHA
jgi:hypothetical protein